MSDAADEAADWAFEHVGLVLSRHLADRLAVFLAAREEAARREEREACVAELYGIVADWPVPEAGATFHEIMMRDEAIMAAIRARGGA